MKRRTLTTHSTLLRSRITGYWIERVRDGMESHPSQGLAMATRGVRSRVKLGTPWFDTQRFMPWRCNLDYYSSEGQPFGSGPPTYT
jgi:hypothetical protein